MADLPKAGTGQKYNLGNNTFGNIASQTANKAGSGNMQPGGLSIVPFNTSTPSFDRYMQNKAQSLQGPAGTSGMAQAYLNYLNKQGAEEETGGGGGGGILGGGGALGRPLGLSRGDIVQLNQAQNRAQIVAAEEAAKQAKNQTLLQTRTGFYGPTAEAYTAAMNAYKSEINRGKNEALGYLGDAIDLSDEDLDSLLANIQDRYGSAVGAIEENYGIGIDELKAYTGQARDDIQSGYDSAIGTYDPLVGIADEGLQAYKDAVLSDFQGQFDQYQQSPVYQFGLQEGIGAIENAAASRGALQSGATMKALNKYATDYAAQQFNQYYNSRMSQLANLAQLGVTGITGQAGLQAQQGQQLADIGLQTGGALADLNVGRGQSLASLYGAQQGQEQSAMENATNRAYQAMLQQSLLSSQAGQARAEAAERGTLGAGQQYQVFSTLSGKRL